MTNVKLRSSNELNCILTESEVRLCEFALTIAVESLGKRHSVFIVLRNKLRKLGYEY